MSTKQGGRLNIPDPELLLAGFVPVDALLAVFVPVVVLVEACLLSRPPAALFVSMVSRPSPF